MEPLSTKDRHMARLYVAGCFHQWEQLPGREPLHTGALQLCMYDLAYEATSVKCSADIARELIASGCSAEELRGCVRHLVV